MISDDYIKRTFPQGRLTILAGKPSVGKTGFVLSVARMLNEDVLYLSLREDDLKVIEAIERQEKREKLMKEWSISLCDTPGIPVEDIESMIAGNVNTIIINYVELLNSHKVDLKCHNRQEELRFIYEHLDYMANKYNIRIIGISMLPKFKNPEYPRFDECLQFLDPDFLLKRLIIIYKPLSNNIELQASKSEEFIELISRDQNEEEVVDRFSMDKDTHSIMRLVSSNKRVGNNKEGVKNLTNNTWI